MQAEVDSLAHWAAWAGQRALSLFLVVQALLLAGICACWWILSRFRASRRKRPLAPSLFPRIAIGCAISLLGVGIFAELAGLLEAGVGLARADLVLTSGLTNSVPQSALQAFAALTHLGDVIALTLLCIGIAIALIAKDQRELALGWVVAVAGNGVLNSMLKQVFARARPLNAEGLALAQGFSFPSGHSSGSVVAYGMLAYLALRLLPARWHLLSLIAAVSLALTIGASRLFLGVHFASDILAGFASGAAWLAMCVTCLEVLRGYRQRTRWSSQASAGHLP